MKEIVEKNENVSFVVPIGTAVENARGTYIGQFNYRPESQSNIAKVNLLTGQSIGSTMTPDNNNGIQRDETHMSAVVGRFLAGYTMGEMLVKHINETIAYSIGYGISFVCNFILTCIFTFKKKASIRRGAGFGLAHAVNYLLHVLLLNLFLWLGLSESLAPLPTFMIVIPVNFLLLHHVFKK